MMFATSLVASSPFVLTPSRAASKRIVVRDLGGVYGRIYREVLYNPFTRASGIEVVSIVSESDPIAQIRTMVETKRYLWDMADLSHLGTALLTTDYLERHGLEHDPVISAIPPQFMSPYMVGTNIYTTVLTHRIDAFKGHRTPESWKDLWDVNRFLGSRGLRKAPFDTIEIALMADGVPLSNVYPCNLDRAFHSLDKIKAHIALWWTVGPQTEHSLKSGQIDLTSAAISRVQSAIDAGAPIAFSWEQHIYGCHGWVILKGSPNADVCRQFIKFASDPKRQALLVPYVAPTQPDALKHIDTKQAKRLSTYPDNLKKGVYIDASYWTKAQKTALQRFNDWLIS